MKIRTNGGYGKEIRDPEGGPGRKTSLIIGFVGLRESLSERGEDRRRMQISQGRKQDSINENAPTILEENEGRESAAPMKGGPNLDDLEVAHGEQSEDIKGRDG